MFRSTLRGVAVALSVVLPCFLALSVVAQEKDEKAAEKQTSVDKEKSTEKHDATAEKAAEKHAEPAAPAHTEPAVPGAHGATATDAHAPSHGSHHDPHDLSHQNATSALEDPSQYKTDLAIATFVVFLCLLALLSKFAWRPIMDGLEAREAGIAASIDEAKRSAEKAVEQLRQYELKLAAATEEARGILDQARRDAESAKERIVAEAQEVAQRERQRAVADITTAKNVALQEMTQKSVDLAVNLAGKIIRKQLKPEDHAPLIREMVDQFPSRN